MNSTSSSSSLSKKRKTTCMGYFGPCAKPRTIPSPFCNRCREAVREEEEPLAFLEALNDERLPPPAHLLQPDCNSVKCGTEIKSTTLIRNHPFKVLRCADHETVPCNTLLPNGVDKCQKRIQKFFLAEKCHECHNRVNKTLCRNCGHANTDPYIGQLIEEAYMGSSTARVTIGRIFLDKIPPEVNRCNWCPVKVSLVPFGH
jgi:hypothetical protein